MRKRFGFYIKATFFFSLSPGHFPLRISYRIPVKPPTVPKPYNQGCSPLQIPVCAVPSAGVPSLPTGCFVHPPQASAQRPSAPGTSLSLPGLGWVRPSSGHPQSPSFFHHSADLVELNFSPLRPTQHASSMRPRHVLLHLQLSEAWHRIGAPGNS